jgi:hypothetical protein
MADGVAYRTERRKRGWIAALIIGLLLGLLLGGYITNKFIDDNNSDSAGKTSSSQQSSNQQNTDSKKTLVAAETTPSVNILLTQYSQMAIEATRESIDAPSDEGNAAKATLDRTTTDLLAAMKVSSSSPLKDDFITLNNALVQYAAAARNSDDRSTVDNAYSKLITDLQKEYTVTDKNEFESRATDLKNNVYDGVRAFIGNDYQTSYTKQLQAEASIHNMFALLQQK